MKKLCKYLLMIACFLCLAVACACKSDDISVGDGTDDSGGSTISETTDLGEGDKTEEEKVDSSSQEKEDSSSSVIGGVGGDYPDDDSVIK